MCSHHQSIFLTPYTNWCLFSKCFLCLVSLRLPAKAQWSKPISSRKRNLGFSYLPSRAEIRAQAFCLPAQILTLGWVSRGLSYTATMLSAQCSCVVKWGGGSGCASNKIFNCPRLSYEIKGFVKSNGWIKQSLIKILWTVHKREQCNPHSTIF